MEPKLSSQSPCSSKGFGTLAIKVDDDELNQDMCMANPLLNPVVLDLLFAQLPIPDLKQARFVCREWGDVGATVLGKRTFLKPCKLVRCDDTTKLSRPAFVSDKLTRRLGISSEYKFDPSVPTKMRGKVITKVIAKVAQLTQELKIRLDQKPHMTAFLSGIRKLKNSTKIRHVSLCIDVKNSWGKTALVLKKLVDQPSLTSFQFKQNICDGYASIIPTYNHLMVQPYLQIWLDAAPNLTVLKISANFFPDLNKCKSIKIFEFEFTQISNIIGLNLTEVAGMLTQIKDSVVEVKLAYEPDEDVMMYYQKEMLDLPVMPNVVTLYAADIYQIHDSLDETRLPKLKKLTLDKYNQISDLSTRQKNSLKQHRGIRSVTMTMEGACNWEKFSETIVQLLPNVTRFDLTWYVGTVSVDHFTKFLEPFEVWKLERGDMLLKHIPNNTRETMVAALRNMGPREGCDSVISLLQC